MPFSWPEYTKTPHKQVDAPIFLLKNAKTTYL
jgi:hypothetical protein